MKKVLCVICLIFILFLIGCNDKEAKKEAEQKVAQYSNYFEQQIKNIYGEKAKLKNIKCKIHSGSSGPIPEIKYWASDLLSADLILNNNAYRAELDIENNIINTDVYTMEIIHDFINLLPIESENIVYIDSDNGSGACEESTFDSSIRNLSDIVKTPSHLNLYIITTENLTNIKQKDFFESSKINDLKDGQMTFSLHIVSISNTEKIEDLKKRIKYIDIYKNVDNDKKEIIDNNSTYNDTSGLNITNVIKFGKFDKNFYYDAYSNN